MPSKPGQSDDTPPSVVSLRHIAEAVGVSRMTVSRAFKAGTQIKPELREKILKAAKELGYTKDTMVSELMSSFANRRPTHFQETFAALWWPQRWHNVNVQSEFESDIHQGLDQGAQLHGRSIDHIVLTEEISSRVLTRMLNARNIQGLILTPPLPSDMQAPDLDWQQFSAVTIGSSLQEPDFNRTLSNHYQLAVLTLKKLEAHGFKKPCLLIRPDLDLRTQRAYSAAFLAWGHPKKQIYNHNFLDASRLKEWLKKTEHDIIIADCERWFSATYIPDTDKAYVSLDVRSQDGSIAGIFQNTKRTAISAVDLLIRSRLMHELGVPKEPIVMLTNGVWQPGKSFPEKPCTKRLIKKAPGTIESPT